MANGSEPRKVLIAGDFTVDLVTNALTNASPRGSRPGADITVVGTSHVKIGGTAYLFANALQSLSRHHALIVAAVGDDLIGHAATRDLTESGFSDSSIQVVNGHSTPIVPTINFGDGTRMMVRPERETLPSLDPRLLADNLKAQEPSDFALTFVSGYLLVSPSLNTRTTLQLIAEWSQSNGVPILVDLVPHEFAQHVGPLSKVHELLGEPDGYVAELQTVRDLALIPPDQGYDKDEQQISTAAIALAGHAKYAIVQHQLKPGIYVQAYATKTRISTPEAYRFNDSDRIGLGDRLLITTLLRHHLL